MENFNLYSDIAMRTNGDIYMGVVGPVRTGKSTLIQRFMDLLVLPGITNEYDKKRARDETPQSGNGRMIMTTQPNFVPNEAVNVLVGENTSINIRMVDCVGYLVEGATGYADDDGERLVKTPWFDDEIPFVEAAELGTKKVINDHSTIGLLVTTDGSITDIPRANYIDAEERVVNELKQIGKPFVMVLNTAQENNTETMKLRNALSEKYDVPVYLKNIMKMGRGDIEDILNGILYEFPVKEINYKLPKWVLNLGDDHKIINELKDSIMLSTGSGSRLRDIDKMAAAFDSGDNFLPVDIKGVYPGNGSAEISIEPVDTLFYKVLGDECDMTIENDAQLIGMMKEMAHAKREYDRVAQALIDVRKDGYGVVAPTIDELTLEEPEIVKQGSHYGVRLKASAPSLHFIRADIETEVSPIVGSEKQSAELVKYLLDEFEDDPSKLWNTDIFGKSLHELVNEGLSNKLKKMPENVRVKIKETLQRVINDNSGGLIFIIL